MPVDLVRDGAIDVLLNVFERGAFVDVALDRKIRRRKVSERGRRFMTQLAYGTVRHKLLCDHVLEGRVRQTLDSLPRPIHAILRMGVYQAIFCHQVTFPAMVHTSVDLAKRRGHAGTARLVNAVLRRAPTSIEETSLPNPDEDLQKFLSIRYSIPHWIVGLWLEQFGDEGARSLCEASNEHTLTSIRVNTAKATLEQARARMEKSGCVVDKRTAIPEELTLLEGTPPAKSKAFREGLIFIQDPASMLPPHLLEPQEGQRVLDLCAAPGGKSTHLAQLAGETAVIIAQDLHPKKIHRVAENRDRLELINVIPVCGDGQQPPFEGPFDAVLVDAPCTGLGTLRRHPDIKWRLTSDSPSEMAAIQLGLLRMALKLCKNQGLVVYSVCTFTAEETEAVVAPLIEEGLVAPENGPDWLNAWKVATGTYQTLPSSHGLDGFYLMRLRKLS
jgi:16S rRNA (cytosine967-C5)-methyltransferase